MTCSDDAYSTNWLGRWWMNGVVDGVNVEGSTDDHRLHAVLRDRVLRARKRYDQRMGGPAQLRSHSVSQESQPESGRKSCSRTAAGAASKAGHKRRCGMASPCGCRCGRAAFGALGCTSLPARTRRSPAEAREERSMRVAGGGQRCQWGAQGKNFGTGRAVLQWTIPPLSRGLRTI